MEYIIAISILSILAALVGILIYRRMTRARITYDEVVGYVPRGTYWKVTLLTSITKAYFCGKNNREEEFVKVWKRTFDSLNNIPD